MNKEERFTLPEITRYEAIKSLLDRRMTNKKAGHALRLSIRQVQRIKKKVKVKGISTGKYCFIFKYKQVFRVILQHLIYPISKNCCRVIPLINGGMTLRAPHELKTSYNGKCVACPATTIQVINMALRNAPV